MKLRIKGDSLRLRVTPSEVDKLLKEGRVAETIHFAPGEEAQLTYALAAVPDASQSEVLAVRYNSTEIAVTIPASLAHHWAGSGEVGLYGQVAVSSGLLEVVGEKDFACLDPHDDENEDRFPNPRHGAIC